jgi:hypothetical protein
MQQHKWMNSLAVANRLSKQLQVLKWGATDNQGQPTDDGCLNCVMTILEIWFMDWASGRAM